jgi:hypothetical protein
MANSVTINEVTITVDDNKNVRISGHNKLFFDSAGDVEINAKNINMNAEEVIRIESGKHLVQKSKRIDLNPVEEEDATST